MKKLQKGLLVSFALATLAGGLLRFLYPLFPNIVTAIFSPVNGSIWEQMKILFFPLAAAGLISRRNYGSSGGWPAAILAACLMQYVVTFFRRVTLGLEAGFFDIAVFVILMALAFLLVPALGRMTEGKWRLPVRFLVVALGAAIVLFTFLPPDHISFADLAGRNTWSVIPY